MGALLALSAAAVTSPAALAAMGTAGAVATLAAHLVKSTTRLTSTAATRGFAQVALSLAEDVVALVLATLSFFLPWFAAVLLAALLFLVFTHRRAVWHAIRVLFFQIQHPRRALRRSPAAGA